MKNLNLTRWQLPAQPERYEESRLVNFLNDPDDYHVVLLASMGMSYNVIAHQTGLSFGQIAYRLRRVNENKKPWEKINSYNFRNGVSETSCALVQLAAKRAAQIIKPHLYTVDIGATTGNGNRKSQ